MTEPNRHLQSGKERHKNRIAELAAESKGVGDKSLNHSEEAESCRDDRAVSFTEP
jgi:hypothetical protein